MNKIIIKTSMLFLLMLSIVSCSKDDDTVVTPEAVTLSSISPTNGPKTTIVTINGNNFGTDLSKVEVYFNEKEANIQSVENTKIITTVPARAYTGDVKVIVDGTELIGPQFTYEIIDIQVTTLAGSTSGDVDGTGSNAKFRFLRSIVQDEQGNSYVADTNNHKIKKITSDGVVTTFAGSTYGYADGSGVNAKFRYPYGLTIDVLGNLYVADSDNHKIRKITPNGVVSTLAGSTSGYADGSGENAKFRSPTAITIDPLGNLFVTDRDNYKIRKITPEGVVSTLAGSTEGYADGLGSDAQFQECFGIAIDAENNLYIADTHNYKISKVTPEGLVSTFAGSISGDVDGVGENAQFKHPTDLVIDIYGSLYVADAGSDKIKKITPTGLVSTIAGSTEGDVNGTGANAKFKYPFGLSIDNDFTLYIADASNFKIKKITQE